MPRAQPSRTVAIAIELHWNVPWHLDTYQGIVDYGNEHGWNCLVDHHLDGPKGDNDLSGYDGVVGRLSEDMAVRTLSAEVPAVNLLSRDSALPSVRADHRACIQLICEHLVSNGYRRLGYIPHTHIQGKTKEFLHDIFTQTAAKFNLPAPVNITFGAAELHDSQLLKTARQRVFKWLKEQEKPIGLLVYQGDIARYFPQICAQLGYRVPEDVGIVAYDIAPATATSITPTISTVDFDCWQWGRHAAAMLDRLMRGESVEPKIQTVPPKRMIARESTDAYVFEDELVSHAMRYIAEHSRQAICINEVASEVGVSRRTLDRRFEDVLGKTVSQEVARLRVEQMQNILSDSNLTMSKIAVLLGFGSASQFTQFFKKHTGLTPSEYRKRNGTGR